MIENLEKLDVLANESKILLDKKYIIILSRIGENVYGVSLNHNGMLCSVELINERSQQLYSNYVKIGSGIGKIEEVAQNHKDLVSAFVDKKA